MDFDEYYRRRHPTDFHDLEYRWHPRNPIAVVYRQQLERALVWAISLISDPLEKLSILDVGCGSGRHIRQFVELGASAQLVRGIDLMRERIHEANSMNPGIVVMAANAAVGLPFLDASFDLVSQFVALSSILDHDERRSAAGEMLRVARPGGWILTYDVVTPDPGNIPDGIPEDAMRALFPGVTWIGSRPLHRFGIGKTAGHPLVSELVEAMPLVRRTNVMMLGRVLGR